MFGLLKKKISGFVEKLSGKKEAEPEEGIAPEVKEGKPEKAPEKEGKGEAPKEEKAPPKKEAAPEKKEAKKKPVKKEGATPEEKKAPAPVKEEKKPEAVKEAKPAPKEEKGPGKAPEIPKEGKKAEKKEERPEKKKGEGPKGKEPEAAPEKEEKEKPPEKKKGILDRFLGKKEEEPEAPKEEKEAKGEVPEEAIEEGVEEPEKPAEPGPQKEERAKERESELKKKVKKGILASVTETIRGESEIREEEVAELLDELEIGMLESDVALSVAEEIKEELRKRIIGAKVKRGQTASFVKESLREILLKMFRETPGFEFSEKFSGAEKPYRIMVVGPNGAGKTTTIAKMIKLLQKEGHSVCVAASDTFRAAAVEQLVHHGNKLGVKVVHGAYGADPTSIAFDAVNYAKSNGLDVVIIDTAGRQETNINLLNQLKKMDRVIKPDLKIYVGESIAGNAMVEQISRFNGDIGLDGVILTKLDCDAKGGTVISVSRVASLPILYVGVGQGYGDMKKFVAEEIVEEILS